VRLPLTDLVLAIRDSWGPDTCAPGDIRDWTPGNPARGHSDVTALVVHDHLGGMLVRGEVVDGGELIGHQHWWNLLADDREIDLTREQFSRSESVVGRLVLERAEPTGQLASRYALLRARLDDRLRMSA